jgi:hypothetical protein
MILEMDRGYGLDEDESASFRIGTEKVKDDVDRLIGSSGR